MGIVRSQPKPVIEHLVKRRGYPESTGASNSPVQSERVDPGSSQTSFKVWQSERKDF